MEPKPNKKCRYCTHRVVIEDECFILNGEHYYCDTREDFCIDGYWWEKENCLLFKEG